MKGTRGALALRAATAAWLCVGIATPAASFEFFDGRVQLHGYFESQIVVLSSGFSDDWDLVGWHQVLDLEAEFDIIQDTRGPIDLLSAYVRVEVRYDCVLTRACGMIKAVDSYGNRARRVPRKRLASARSYPHAGAIPLFAGTPADYLAWVPGQ